MSSGSQWPLPHEFYDPMTTYSGNKTNLLINGTTTPKPSSQSFASPETLPQFSATTFNVSQNHTAALTSSSPQGLISSVNSTLLQQTSPTNYLQQQTSDRKKTDFPQAPTEKTSSLTSPPPLVSVTHSVLLDRLTSSTKQKSPEQVLTLPVKQESPQQLMIATEIISSQQLMSTVNLTLSKKPTSALEPTSGQQQTTAVKLSSSQDVTTVSPWQITLPLNVTHSQKPFSGQIGENEAIQYFKGSFKLVNEIYHPNYSDSTSDDFRNEALKLENMIGNAFAKSRLKQRYQDSSIMALKPSPFRAHFIVRMSRGFEASRLSPNTVAQEMIQGYQKASGNGVLMDEKSVQVEEYNGLCLLKPSSLSLLNGVSDNWNDGNLDTKEGFPWHVTVLKNGDPACLGSLITEQWVLSASSCVASRSDQLDTCIRMGTNWFMN
ncbi:uncharacterized protein LOC132587364 [Heteronotia binoei]|uniref:uncharacterized protein LOC132587364 n=1 Tax=Heteronotia binoei TaxID=13085 RepID=UPI00292FE810|nr:uncharacterized protein LOC132587364 [Heteronotia binoei]